MTVKPIMALVKEWTALGYPSKRYAVELETILAEWDSEAQTLLISPEIITNIRHRLLGTYESCKFIPDSMRASDDPVKCGCDEFPECTHVLYWHMGFKAGGAQ